MERLERRVVVTGIGLVTPLGIGTQQTWEAAIAGKSGVGPITHFDAKDLPCRIAGEVKGFDSAAFMDKKEARRNDLFIQYGLAASQMALQDARLPTIYGSREYVEAGGLMSYGPSYTDLFRRAADYVDKILRGAKPGEIPVEQPTKFDLAINLTTAKALGLTIPESFLLRADEIVE